MDDRMDGNAIFIEILPKVLRHALFAFRGIKDFNRFEDCVQETLCLCWQWTCRLWGQGKDARRFPATLASYANRHMRSGRSFVSRKTYRNDTLSPLAQTVHGLLTQALPSVEAEHGSPWMAALQDNTVSPVAEQVAFRMDFPAWLATLSERNRRLAEDMTTGETTLEWLARHGVSAGRISQLRRQFIEEWTRFCGPVA